MAAYSAPKLKKQNGLMLLPAIIRLMGWRFKNTWQLLLVTWLSLVTLIALVCAVPLMSNVAGTAGLRGMIKASYTGPNVELNLSTTRPSKEGIQNINQEVQKVFARSIQDYIGKDYSLRVSLGEVNITLPGKEDKKSFAGLSGVDWKDKANKAPVIQGRLPQYSKDVLEVALLNRISIATGLKVGDTFYVYSSATTGSVKWLAKVVGILGENPFDPGAKSPTGVSYDANIMSGGGGDGWFELFTDVDSVIERVTPLKFNQDRGVDIFMRYPLLLEKIDAASISDLEQKSRPLTMGSDMGLANAVPGIMNANFGGALYVVNQYKATLIMVQIVIVLLLVLILCLAFYMVNLMANVLVERQEAVIATLRSRGATRRHIFGAFFWQIAILWLAALVAAPFVAIQLVRFIISISFTQDDQRTGQILLSDQFSAIQSMGWLPVVIVVVALIVMVLALRKALKSDVLAMRREGSRSSQRPFWRRMNLDLIAAVLLVVGYAGYVYFTQFSGQLSSPVRAGLFGAVAFITVPAVVLVAILFFMRLVPGIMHLATRVATRQPSAAPTLAFAQMERAPRNAGRMITLLALAISVTIFGMVMISSLKAYQSVAATFRVGADFSGGIDTTLGEKTPAEQNATYREIAGVNSSAIGYRKAKANTNGQFFIYQVMAVEPEDYGKTAIWPDGLTQTPIKDLMQQLAEKRKEAQASNSVYAIVDAATWKLYNLSVGATFDTPMPDTDGKSIHFVALGKVENIPSFYNDANQSNSNAMAVLVDWESYSSAFKKATGTELVPNQVWLKTSDNSETLNKVRETYPDLLDRRQLIEDEQNNIMSLTLSSVLTLGIALALLLALIGTILSAWFSAASRKTNFAVMRALGMARTQIIAIIVWEQSFVYLLAFLVGIGLGAMLQVFIAPILGLLRTSLSGAYGTLNIPEITLSVPWLELGLVLAGVIGACLLALILMARIITGPIVSQRLRLNED